MIGPSVKVDITGRTGLLAKDYDQVITVIPRVSSTLPLVGALAVNPAVGVALADIVKLGRQVLALESLVIQLP